MRATKIITFLAIALFCTYNLIGATYYASPTGNSTECTLDSPGSLKQAIAKAVSGTSWEDGDTVILLESDTKYTISDAQSITISAAYLTIKSENGNPDKAVIYRGGNSQRCFVVTTSFRLEGVTLSNFYTNDVGGAIQIAALTAPHNVVIDNCKFIGNLVNNTTAGVYSSTIANDVVVKNSYFDRNKSNSGSGSCLANIKLVKNCFFTNNISPANGTAVISSHIYDSKFHGNTGNINSTKGVVYGGSATRCEFINNTSMCYGGAVASCATTNCLIMGNQAKHGGATWGNCNIYGSKLINNSSSYSISFGGDGMVIANCLIIGNSTTTFANRNTFEGCTLQNCTIISNKIQYAVMYNDGAAYNCIFRGNSPYDLRYVNSTIRAYNSICETSHSYPASASIFKVDPLFAVPTEKTPAYSLQKRSPAVDAGIDYGYFSANAYDITGKNLRFRNTIDIGCYEYWPPLPTIFTTR